MDAATLSPKTLDHGQILDEIKALIAANRLIMPGVPEVANRVRQVAADPDGSAARIAAVVSEDPALAAHLIKVSNTVARRRGGDIRSVASAVMRLGFKLTAVTATSFSILQMMAMAHGQVDRVRKLYRHSVEVGERCYALAQRRAGLLPEDALLAGLVHDIGVLAVLQYVRDKNLRVAPAVLDALIREIHPDAGAALLRAWGFPEALIEAVEAHEDWYRERPDGRPDYADVLIAANMDVHRGSQHPMATLEHRPPSALARLKLNPGVSIAAQCRLEEEASRAQRLCGLDQDGEDAGVEPGSGRPRVF